MRESNPEVYVLVAELKYQLDSCDNTSLWLVTLGPGQFTGSRFCRKHQADQEGTNGFKRFSPDLASPCTSCHHQFATLSAIPIP
jgi:hypothetical protein